MQREIRKSKIGIVQLYSNRCVIIYFIITIVIINVRNKLLLLYFISLYVYIDARFQFCKLREIREIRPDDLGKCAYDYGVKREEEREGEMAVNDTLVHNLEWLENCWVTLFFFVERSLNNLY